MRRSTIRSIKSIFVHVSVTIPYYCKINDICGHIYQEPFARFDEYYAPKDWHQLSETPRCIYMHVRVHT